ncbi:MAG: hypothetical protein OEZ39_18095 [Gammaproteobacteria bacterium]|nr:hypothetical protein [Gammaproteobacteria bacterium]MDH5653778.1 hypothetical protein [Gammaproteobacteria bacterium]
MFIRNHSLFSFGHLLDVSSWLDRRLNPYRHSICINYQGHPLRIHWTRRADTQLKATERGLIIEMQLYFSCVIKKRVLFHHEFALPTIPVNNDFSIAFHAVEAAACDPEAFVKNYPAKRILDSAAALKMRPVELRFDYPAQQWSGEFTV